MIIIYHGELNEFKPHERVISSKDFCLFVLLVVSWSYLYSGSYQGYAIQLLMYEFAFIISPFAHVEAYEVPKLVRTL